MDKISDAFGLSYEELTGWRFGSLNVVTGTTHSSWLQPLPESPCYQLKPACKSCRRSLYFRVRKVAYVAQQLMQRPLLLVYQFNVSDFQIL